MTTPSPVKWTDDLFATMSAEYVKRMDELPDDATRAAISMEVVSEIAQKAGVTPNGFRMKLTTAGLYIKKEQAKGAKAASGEGKSTGARTTKATAHAEFVSAFVDAGLSQDDIDMAIVEKLTGKAASHIAELIRKITK